MTSSIEHRSLPNRAFADFVDRIRPLFGDGDRVLDLACGSSRLAAHLRDDPVTVVGIDADRFLVECARSVGLPVQSGRAESLPFADRSFDVVVARRVLHHSAEPGRVVAEALRVCRRLVVIEEPGFAEPIADEIDRLTKRWERRLGIAHFPVLGESEIGQLVVRSPRGQMAGFTFVVSDAEPFDLDEARRRYASLGARVGTAAERRRFDDLLERGRRAGPLKTASILCRSRV